MDNSIQPPAPVVPDESVVMPGSNSTPPISANGTGTSSPTSSGTVRPKRKLGPIVATIFGLLLLVGGVGVGLVLVNQRQILNQKAAGSNCVDPNTNQSIAPGSQVCTSCNGSSGNGIVCQPDGTFGPCVRLDSCGARSNLTPGSFVSCGGSTGGLPGDDGNRCSNCFANGSGGVTCGQQNLTSSCACAAGCPAAMNGQCGTSGGGGGGTQPTAPPSSGGGGSCSSGWCTTQSQCQGAGGQWGGQSSYCTQGSVGPVGQCCLPSSGGGGGGGSTPKPECGSACKQTSDCHGADNGGQVTCTNGLCQNAACIGHTIPGANCDCSSLNACGQPCSASLGLCQAGSICRFVSGPSCTNVAGPNYCFPTGPHSGDIYATDNLPAGWSTTICAGNTPGNANFYVLDASGQNPYPAEIAATCLAAIPTPTPAPTASCTSVKAYDSNWNLLTSTQLNTLTAGSTVNFTVMGTTSAGVFDKAAFTINGILNAPVSTTKPGSPGEFYMTYTIPAGVTNFTVTAQLHQQILNQWF